MEQKMMQNLQVKRTEKLLTALRMTNECAHAILFLLEKYANLPTIDIGQQTETLEENQKRWNDMLEQTINALDLQRSLISLYKSLCPLLSNKILPNTFEVADTLRAIGYYDGNTEDQHGITLSKNDIVAYLCLMEDYISQTMEALVNVDYKDEWKSWGKYFSDLYMSMPFASISDQNRMICYINCIKRNDY